MSVVSEGQGCTPVNADVRLHAEQGRVRGLITSFRDCAPRPPCPLLFQVTRLPPVSGNLLGRVISKPCSFPKSQDADECSWFTQVYFPRPLLERGHGGGTGAAAGADSPGQRPQPTRGRKSSFISPPSLSPTCSFSHGRLQAVSSLCGPPPGGPCSSVQMRFGHFFLCAAAVPPLSSLPCVVSPRLPPPPPSSGWRAGPGVVLTQILSGPWSWTPDFCTLGSSLMMMADSDSDSGGPEGFPAAAPW